MIEIKETRVFHGILRVWHMSLGCLVMALVGCSAQLNTISNPDPMRDSFVEGHQSLADASVQFSTSDVHPPSREVHVMRPVSGIHEASDASGPRLASVNEPKNLDANRETDPFDDPFADPFADNVLEEVHDPWESFNTTMFAFNRNVDRYVLKPVATAYDFVMPDFMERGIRNGFHNFGVVSRVVNNLLQAKFEGAGLEFSRFLINSTVGIAGLMDVAKDNFDMETPDEDLGQTLAVYGTPSGPYLVLPFLPPLTVRDAGAYVGDVAMNPANWLLPFVPTLIAMKGGEVINDRSLNLDRYEGVEETTVDLYGAVRDAYIQKRARAIKE
jgi:phospholipid-binding lipoprotein MlaA